MRNWFISMLLLECLMLSAQQKAEVKGFFLSDSVKVGEHIAYSVSVQYHKKYQVFFPDTAFDYQPFEFIRKEFFSTKEKNGSLFDSAIYYLRTFETDSLLVYSLPVFLFNAKDTVSLFSNLDTVMFKSVLPDTLTNAKLFSDTKLVEIPKKPNYLLHAILVLSVLVLFALLWKLIGKKLLKIINDFNVKRKHKVFLSQFETCLNSLKTEDRTETWNLALALWKKHIGLLTSKNVESLTTREICIELNNNNLKKPLQQIDNRVYGNVKIDPASNLNYLLEVVKEIFEETQGKKT
ncbi:MAG: hypothetical protein SNJ77_05505 [Cytophagales bacterium]